MTDAATSQLPSAAKLAASVEETTEGILPIVVMAMMRRNGHVVSAARYVSASFGAPNEEDHEHEHLEARRILKPLHALEPLAGDEHLDDAHPEAPDQRYDGQRAQRVAQKAQGRPLPEPERVPRAQLERLARQHGDDGLGDDERHHGRLRERPWASIHACSLSPSAKKENASGPHFAITATSAAAHTTSVAATIPCLRENRMRTSPLKPSAGQAVGVRSPSP